MEGGGDSGQLSNQLMIMAEEQEKSITSAWLQRHSKLYQSATRAPFILAIRDGSLDFQSYTRWLEQDYVFVKSFVRFLGGVLAKAPASVNDEEVDTLLGGLDALQQELAWFRSQAVKWNLKLDRTAVHQTTQRYCKFLSQLAAPDVDYTSVLATLWVIEVVYNECFATCLEADANTAPELQEACQRWGNQEFKGYCLTLQGLTDRALEQAPPAIRDKAESLFVQVLTLEVDFWSMAINEKSH